MSVQIPLRAAASAAATSLFGLAVACSSALAAADSEDTPLKLDSGPVREVAQAPGTGGGGIGRALFGLMLVVGLIFALHWVLRRVQESKTSRATGAGLQPVAALPLGQRGALHVVRAGREVVLVGVADGQIVPIRSYSEAEAQAAGLLAGDEVSPSGPAPLAPARPSLFGGVMSQLRSRTVRG